MRRTTVLLIVAACMFSALSVGCTPSLPTFVSEGRSYDSKAALRLADEVPDPNLSAVPVSNAVARRHDALVTLRSQGGSAAQAAELITKIFPSDTSAVPYYIEEAEYEGTPVFVIIEALGPRDGTLTDERTWVVSKDGDVLISGTR